MGSNTSTEEKSDFEARVKIPSELVKGPWKKQEDELLANLVEEHGPKDWSKIASKMAQLGHVRMGKQCRERWFNHLSPEVRKEAWTAEEDRVIIESHRQLGNKWTAISRLLNGRPANAIKNHWNSTLKRQVQFGEIGSGSPRPGKRQRSSSVGHPSRKKRRLDVSSYEESDEDFDSTSEEMDEDDDLLSSPEGRTEDQDQVAEDRTSFATVPAEVAGQTAVSESEDEDLTNAAAPTAAPHDPLAMDTTNPVWNLDINVEYDSMQVSAQGYQFQQHTNTFNNYNMYNTAVFPVMNEFHEHHEQRQPGFNSYWDPFEFGGSSYSP
jgi:hypothetical protein